ncbi:MAG: EamA family transporter RarD [Pseudomonadota bacterium]
MTEDRAGLIAALVSFVCWGLSPAFFKFLGAVSPAIIIGHRVIWAALLLAAFLYWRDGRAMRSALRLEPRQYLGLAITAALISGNWLLFVWAVNNGQVLATSLGYFINPLITVLLGLVVLRERLGPRKQVAVVIATVATIGLGWILGEPPWIALGLAFSFGIYGLLRKMLRVRPLVGLLWETLLMLPLALWYLGGVAGFDAAWTTIATTDRLLLVVSGLVTIVPLIAFNIAAQKLPLNTLGFLQYLAPTISFVLAVFVYREPFGLAQLVAFSGIWVALVLFTLPERRVREASPG